MPATSMFALQATDSILATSLSASLTQYAGVLQHAWQRQLLAFSGVQLVTMTETGELHISHKIQTAVEKAHATEGLSFAWKTCAENVVRFLLELRERNTSSSTSEGDVGSRTILALVPSKILEAIYTTTYAHLSVSEQNPNPPSTRILNWHSETHLQGRSHYRNFLIGLSSQDLRYSVPDAELVNTFAGLSIMQLLATLSDDRCWEWEAYLELHRRVIVDWLVFGPSGDFPFAGTYAGRIEHNKGLLERYDTFWGVGYREGKTFMVVPTSETDGNEGSDEFEIARESELVR